MKKVLNLIAFTILLIGFVGCNNSPDLAGEWKTNEKEYYSVLVLEKEGDSYNIKSYQMYHKGKKGETYEFLGKLIDNTINIDGYFTLKYSQETGKLYKYGNSVKKEFNRVE